ncbi:restriction endonuclease subunit S [Corynebacterium sp. c25Ua_89]|uniref:restriction endonuclease subunit S n=1 Tax=Corynebacterium sp. c25Ua_89 TaxID=3032356 RepID=UPI0039C268AF
MKKIVSLKEVCESDYGVTASATEQPTGTHFLRITDIVNFTDYSGVPFVDIDDEDRRKKLLKQNDIVVARTGATVGASHLFRGTEPTVFASYLVRFRPKTSDVDPVFVSYVLNSPAWKQFIFANAHSKSAQPNLSAAAMMDFQFSLPEIREQQKIASVLKALDDKISTNSRIIKIATHLNINLVEKSVTKKLEHLQNLADITMGSSPKGEFLNEEGIGEPFFQGVRDFGELFPSERVFAEKAVRTAQEGDILFAVRAPIGEVNIAERPCVIGRGIAAIRGKQSHLGLFYLLKGHPELWETYQSSGTVFAGINKSDLHNAVIPVLRDFEKLEQQLTPIHERAMHALRENQTLASTRDELLPLLMSGRITVGEAEDAADVAGTAASES